jgi:FtsZ-binding cell division protein ZapB
MTAEQTRTTITQPLILELIKTISQNTDELHKLRSEVEQLAKEKRALIRDVACMSRGVEEFKTKFEPYLSRAIEEEKVWQERRRSITTAVIKWGLFGMLSFVVWSSWESFVDVLRHRR